MSTSFRNVPDLGLCPCPDGFRPNYGQRSCYNFAEAVMTWSEGQQHCAEQGAFLLEVDNMDELWFINSTVGQHSLTMRTVKLNYMY